MNDPHPTRSWWDRLWMAPRARWLLGIPAGALLCFVLGIVAWAGAGAALHATSNTAFCAYACHEMAAFVVPDWRSSTHYKNARGLHAGCEDCHVPGPAIPKLLRKLEALNEGWQHLAGKISTQARFDAHKLEMAKRVWAAMKATDSRECRRCHDAATMDLPAQDRSAQRKHEQMKASGETCIDCHKGVAHPLPPEAPGATSGTGH
jgi:nitrate/TMAO reductase-like tetraheme cytochrome c subunit